MRTTYTTTNGYTIELEQIDGLGSPWMVRSYKNLAFLKRRISSDWFLNGEQAKTFAQQLQKDLESDKAASTLIQTRKPGWTLRRPVH
jgi:hypothetical protein